LTRKVKAGARLVEEMKKTSCTGQEAFNTQHFSEEKA